MKIIGKQREFYQEFIKEFGYLKDFFASENTFEEINQTSCENSAEYLKDYHKNLQKPRP